MVGNIYNRNYVKGNPIQRKSALKLPSLLEYSVFKTYFLHKENIRKPFDISVENIRMKPLTVSNFPFEGKVMR